MLKLRGHSRRAQPDLRATNKIKGDRDALPKYSCLRISANSYKIRRAPSLDYANLPPPSRCLSLRYAGPPLPPADPCYFWLSSAISVPLPPLREKRSRLQGCPRC